MPRSSPLPLVLILVPLAACGPMSQDGEELRFRSGGDLVATGEVVEVAETVEGDVMMAGQNVAFSGSVGGSVLSVGGAQVVGGVVSGSIRAAGGSVRLTGQVERNVTLAGADVAIDRDADVALNAYVVGNRVELLGAVRGHLRVAAREVVLNGPVTGNVDVVAGRLTLGPSARIDGDLSYRVREGGVAIDPGALVAGETMGVTAPGPSTTFHLLLSAGRLAGFLLVGVVLLLVVPPLARTLDGLHERPGATLGLGLLWMVALPVMTFAAAVTVVGIPLAVIACGMYLAALYAAPVVPGLWLGASLLDRPGGEATHPAKAFLLGGAILGVIMLLPWIGFPVRLLATAGGFGAVAVAIRARL